MITYMAIVRPNFAQCCFYRNDNLFFSNSNKVEIYSYSNTLLGCSRNNLFVNGAKRWRSISCARVSIELGRLSRRRRSNWRVNASDVRVIEKNSNAQTRIGVVDIPVSCYQLLGLPSQAEKDEIVKSVMHLKNAEIEEGYTIDASVSRQNLLMDVRDKLLFEPEYAGNTREKILPKNSLRIPWAWLSGALCLLQEVGEQKLVLDIGRTALNHADARLYIHDLLLSMALAECAIAKMSFEKNKISQGFEALARAQCLLRSNVSLEKMPLLFQIEESLEELAPACTLEILGMPHIPENAERRLGAIAALRELLRQGLDVETSCQVQDWPMFFNQALHKLLATEIVELLPWDNLASIRKNKKSIESQNQRVVIDFNCFYFALIAHIALGFSSHQRELINKAKIICESLIASEGIDIKFEEAFCLFLLGQGDESVAAEKLRQLNLNTNTTSRNLLSGKDIKDMPSAKQLLEAWMKDSVLVLFPDTRDSSPSFEKFFDGEKKAGNREKIRAPQNSSPTSFRPLSPSPSDYRTYEQPDSSINSSPHLGTAVKQLAPQNLHGPTSAKANTGNNSSSPSIQLKRTLGAHQNQIWDIWFIRNNVSGNIIVVTALGCIFFFTLKLMGVQLRSMQIAVGLAPNKPKMASSFPWSTDPSLNSIKRPAYTKGNSIANRLKQLLPTQKMQFRSSSEDGASQITSVDGINFAKTATYRRAMQLDEAETLVKQWQTIKAEALGPNHQVHGLFEVLDKPMLVQWQALADTAKTRSCFWRFVLLQLSILRADILSDDIGNEMAEIEALLEEAAELVDVSQPKNPNYYSTYTIRYLLKRQGDGSWRFCEGDILSS